METKICVTGFIYDKNTKKVLIVKRSDKESFFPGVYEMLGGKLEFGENVQKGVAREVKEETGLDVEVGGPFRVFDYISKDGDWYNVEIVFICYVIPNELKVTLSDGHVDYKWISNEEIGKYELTEEIEKGLRIGFEEVSD